MQAGGCGGLGGGGRETRHPSGAVRSCQRTGSRPLARRGRASQLSPLRRWLRPSIWLREAHRGRRGTGQIPDYTRVKAGISTQKVDMFSCADKHMRKCLSMYNDIHAAPLPACARMHSLLPYARCHQHGPWRFPNRQIGGNRSETNDEL